MSLWTSRRIWSLALVFIAFAPAASAAPPCESEAWAFYGAVRDGGGRPIGDARVHLLLDKIDKAAYVRGGVRAKSFWTNEYGKYQAGLICSDESDAPNPCARKRKHLSVAVDADGFTMTMKVFKLRDLEVRPTDEGACFVQVPEIRLKKGY